MMKSEPKAFASLSSGLLARKGAARPAMRPQGFGQMGANLDDLGWNDMGFEPPRPALASVSDDEAPAALRANPAAGLTPASPVHAVQEEIVQRLGSDSDAGDEEDETAEPVADDVPPLAELLARPGRAEAAETAELIETPAAAEVVEAPAPAPAPRPRLVKAAAPRAVRGASTKGKAAFTLRLDGQRHLKLRLACAVTGTSAQQLVTRALDELLAQMPELDAMAERAPERVASKG